MDVLEVAMRHNDLKNRWNKSVITRQSCWGQSPQGKSDFSYSKRWQAKEIAILLSVGHERRHFRKEKHFLCCLTHSGMNINMNLVLVAPKLSCNTYSEQGRTSAQGKLYTNLAYQHQHAYKQDSKVKQYNGPDIAVPSCQLRQNIKMTLDPQALITLSPTSPCTSPR